MYSKNLGKNLNKTGNAHKHVKSIILQNDAVSPKFFKIPPRGKSLNEHSKFYQFILRCDISTPIVADHSSLLYC